MTFPVSLCHSLARMSLNLDPFRIFTLVLSYQSPYCQPHLLHWDALSLVSGMLVTSNHCFLSLPDSPACGTSTHLLSIAPQPARKLISNGQIWSPILSVYEKIYSFAFLTLDIPEISQSLWLTHLGLNVAQDFVFLPGNLQSQTNPGEVGGLCKKEVKVTN